MLARIFALVVASSAVVACSSADSDPASKSGPAGVPAAFAKYCTGTLLTEHELMQPTGAGSWKGDGVARAAAGTTFVLEARFGDEFEGYVFGADGTPAKLDHEFGKGLKKDTHFTTDCDLASTSDFSRRRLVLLTKATLYPSKDLSGTACVLDAGTDFNNYGYSGGSGEAASFESEELEAKCGFVKGYTKDMTFAKLLSR